MANIPDTNTFTLQNVVDKINPTTDDLQDCFNDSVDAYFDIEYKGDKNSLLNFRNYGGKAWFISIQYPLLNIDRDPFIQGFAFSSTYGDETPDSFTTGYAYQFFDSSLNAIGVKGGANPKYLNNTNAIEYITWESAISFRDYLISNNYTGNFTGTFYFALFLAVGSLPDRFKVQNTDDDFYDPILGAVFCKFTAYYIA